MLRFNNFNEDSFENVAEVWGVGGGGNWAGASLVYMCALLCWQLHSLGALRQP